MWWIFREMRPIPVMMRQGARRQVSEGPKRKSRARQTPGKYGKADPFQYFADMIRATYPVKKIRLPESGNLFHPVFSNEPRRNRNGYSVRLLRQTGLIPIKNVLPRANSPGNRQNG